MKKITLYLMGLIIPFYTYPQDYLYNNYYTKIDKKIHNIPKIIEFFSFYCTYCYEFNIIKNIPKKIEKKLNKNIKIKFYHVNFLGKLGKELTQAWNIATILNKEKKIEKYIFERIKKKKIKNKKDIEKILLNIGLKKKIINIIKKSFVYQTITKQQKNILKKIKIKSVPIILINGRYIIYNNLIFKKEKNFEKYMEKINFLINH